LFGYLHYHIAQENRARNACWKTAARSQKELRFTVIDPAKRLIVCRTAAWPQNEKAMALDESLAGEVRPTPEQ
jgi:hypothetical protein